MTMLNLVIGWMGLSIEQYTPLPLIFLVSVTISNLESDSFNGITPLILGYFLLSFIKSRGRLLLFLQVRFETVFIAEIARVSIVPLNSF
jgi:hypothetical protein